MNPIDFKPVFDYMDKKFSELDSKFVIKTDLEGIINVLDKILVIVQRLDQERIVTNRRLDRLEPDNY